MPSSSTPCAESMCIRRKCMPGACIFAQYFPHDNPEKFISMHKVYGASNMAKLLRELSLDQLEDAVNSLAYEAEFRLRDPVYGSIGLILMLQKKLKDMENVLENTKKELATYMGPTAMFSEVNHPEMMQQLRMTDHRLIIKLCFIISGDDGTPDKGPQGVRLVIREPQQHQHRQQQ